MASGGTLTKIDFNRMLIVFALIALVTIAALTNNRLEIGPEGIKFEKNPEPADGGSELLVPPKN